MYAVLREIVELHIATGAPVGSKAVAHRLPERPSSATVRAVMGALAERGWISQPHTSSGRVPTDEGYRVYLARAVGTSRARLDDLDDSRVIDALARGDDSSVRGLLREAARLLVDRLDVAGVVAAPQLDGAVLRHIEFVGLGRHRLLAIVVTAGGVVRERLLRVSEAPSAGTLERLSNYLMSFLPGLTLAEVRARLDAERSQAQHALTALEAQAVDLGRRAVEGTDQGDVVVDGAAAVLERAQFTDPARAAELVRTLDERTAWLDVLAEVAAAEDLRVYVGAELGAAGLADCAVVVSPYRAPSGAGMVAVVGPKRLDYRRTIPFVRALAVRLEDLMEVAKETPDRAGGPRSG